MCKPHVYKDRRTGSVMARTDHKLHVSNTFYTLSFTLKVHSLTITKKYFLCISQEVIPGLVELHKEDMNESLEEVSMTREEKKDYIDSYIQTTLDLIPPESDEMTSFKSSIPSMKDFLLHCDGLHFYAEPEDLKNNREKSTMIYGLRSSEDELFMISGGLVEDNSRT